MLDTRYWKNIFKVSNLLKTAVVCTAVVATIMYGRWRISQEDEFVETGPVVASLQSNVPQSVKREALRGQDQYAKQTSQTIFDELMQKSKASAQAGAELIVWPETMVQATLNPEVLALVDPSHPWKAFDKALREHSKDTAFVLVGAYGGVPDESKSRLAEKYNSAFLYKPDGQQSDKQYSKIHLVLFGEVLPFKKSFPLLFKLVMKFNPYNYDHSLDAGSEYTVFEMTRLTKKLTAENAETAEKKDEMDSRFRGNDNLADSAVKRKLKIGHRESRIKNRESNLQIQRNNLL